MRLLASALLSAVVIGIAGCGDQQAAKPPEKRVSITTATAVSRDLPVTESAVGALTSILTSTLDDGHGAPVSVRLPFPDHIARRLKVGQSVTLSGFLDSSRNTTGQIREIRPALNSTTQSMEVIVSVADRRWRPAGSIRGEVVLDVRRGAVLVPEQAVVLRPAGQVVYVISGESVAARQVRTGITRDGLVEIVEGLKPGERVANDGAALLSDGAKVVVRESSS